MKDSTQINCPNCGESINVQNVLAHQLEDEIKRKYQSQITEEKKKYDAEQQKLSQERKDFEKKKKQENELFQERLEKQLKEERKLVE